MSAARIGLLLIRTFARPITVSIENYSTNHPRFRKFCINVATATHRFEMYLSGQKSLTLDDAKAVKMGANFLGEFILFGVATSIIVWDQAKSHRNHKNWQNSLNDSIERLRNETSKLRETNKAFENKLKMQIKKLQEDNEELRNQILAMELKSRKVADF
ncbi:optic atrophy 3 protein [Gigaspora rosea]|uniref:Optic atrophy 3 protein n=1 Tax=Gigaspora rosea TaxID=44941 RepID=A0A397VFL0_9GLOM|nr:optic atrophy 3 protein [Gigaspora rosea]